MVYDELSVVEHLVACSSYPCLLSVALATVETLATRPR